MGCLRTLDEIAAWGALDNAERRRVWHSIEQRRAEVGPHFDGFTGESGLDELAGEPPGRRNEPAR